MKKIKELMVYIAEKKYLITSDDNYLNHIKKGFEPEMVALLKTLATNSDTILDIGANIGCTSILFGDLAKKVYAFEPSPTTFAFLEKNISNSGKKNIFLQNIGIGAESIETNLTFDPSNRSSAFISNQIHPFKGHTVEKIIVQQLDKIINTLGINNIDFIKIDVEGFEGSVIRGAIKTLLYEKPLVVLELNHWCLNVFQRTSIPDFFDLLRSIFPILLAIDGSNYLDLHNENDSFIVMYHHVLNMKFKNIVAGFDETQLNQFRTLYKYGFLP